MTSGRFIAVVAALAVAGFGVAFLASKGGAAAGQAAGAEASRFTPAAAGVQVHSLGAAQSPPALAKAPAVRHRTRSPTTSTVTSNPTTPTTSTTGTTPTRTTGTTPSTGNQTHNNGGGGLPNPDTLGD
jgi:hypothetical protein